MGHSIDTLQEYLALSSAQSSVKSPPEVLVVDRVNGPADILIDTISRLAERDVTVTLVEDQVDALRALNCCTFDLLVVGLEPRQSLQLIVLSRIHEAAPDLPIVVVGRALPRIYKQYARYYGAREVLDLPDRAADLKALMLQVAESYLKRPPLSLELAYKRRVAARSECREAV